jgi:hypothetical protein
VRGPERPTDDHLQRFASRPASGIAAPSTGGQQALAFWLRPQRSWRRMGSNVLKYRPGGIPPPTSCTPIRMWECSGNHRRDQATANPGHGLGSSGGRDPAQGRRRSGTLAIPICTSSARCRGAKVERRERPSATVPPRTSTCTVSKPGDLRPSGAKIFFTHYESRLRDNERRVLHGAPLRGGPALHYHGNLVSAQALPR